MPRGSDNGRRICEELASAVSPETRKESPEAPFPRAIQAVLENASELDPGDAGASAEDQGSQRGESSDYTSHLNLPSPTYGPTFTG